MDLLFVQGLSGVGGGVFAGFVLRWHEDTALVNVLAGLAGGLVVGWIVYDFAIASSNPVRIAGPGTYAFQFAICAPAGVVGQVVFGLITNWLNKD